MASAVEADLAQLDLLMSLHRRTDRRSTRAKWRARSAPACARNSTTNARRSWRGSRVMLADRPFVRVPRVSGGLSTRRLLTLQWLDGEPLVAFENAPQESRNTIAVALFEAWWRPFLRYGVIHGDPHLGNYSVLQRPGGAGEIEALNLFDYGCVRIFPAFRAWRRRTLSRARERSRPARQRLRAVGIRQAFARNDRGDEHLGPLHLRPDPRRSRAQRRRRDQTGRIRPARNRRGHAGSESGRRRSRLPREFVFLERATIGLGALSEAWRATQFHRLYEAAIADFDEQVVARRQAGALEAVELGARARRPNAEPPRSRLDGPELRCYGRPGRICRSEGRSDACAAPRSRLSAAARRGCSCPIAQRPMESTRCDRAADKSVCAEPCSRGCAGIRLGSVARDSARASAWTAKGMRTTAALSSGRIAIRLYRHQEARRNTYVVSGQTAITEELSGPGAGRRRIIEEAMNVQIRDLTSPRLW